jgi:YD repeat-containing protein
MNEKYQRYINYIVNELKPPYFINMRDNYGLSEKEYELALSKLYDQPVTIKGNDVYNTNDKLIYSEDSDGFWYKHEYDANGNEIYLEDGSGFWYKEEYDSNGNEIYYEDSNGHWVKSEYDEQGKIIYQEDSDGHIDDYR